MNRTRREFIVDAVRGGAAIGLGGALAAQAFAADEKVEKAKKRLTLLILGGTGFLGPHTVRRAIARGHEMTLFNRGKTNPDLFPDLTHLKGDRYDDISALESGEWDAVIDTFTYIPRVVKRSADLLSKRVGQYVVISTISVYRDYMVAGMDEDYPKASVPADAVESIKHHRDVMPHYGGMKALCEQAAEEAMPGRVCNIRPGLIVGPGDPTDRFTYWPVRVSRGGEVLAPGDGEGPLQVIDVRALASFIIHAIEKRATGAFNADSPPGKFTIGDVVRTSKEVSDSDARITWVPKEFLEHHQVAPWSHMPAWVPAEGEYAGFGQVSTKRAQQLGLECPPMKDTVEATLEWWKTLPEQRRANLRAGIKPDREQEVLAAWKKANGG